MDIQIWLADAQQLFQQGELSAALDLLNAGLAKDPSQADGWRLKVKVLESLNRHEAEKVWNNCPDDHVAWHNRGNALAVSGHYEKAIASYDQALHYKPDLYEAWYNRGVALYALGRKEEAISSYDQALHDKPDEHEAWTNRGVALADLGRYEEAIASYDQVLHDKPDYHVAWTNRGNALYDLGRYEEAIASYDQALHDKPDKHEAWNNRGNALSALGRYEEAIASYDQALHDKPDKHEAWYNRGVALSALGRKEEAIASYDQALHYKPDYHEAWNNRGVALSALEREEEAITSYDRTLHYKPDLHEAWTNRAAAICSLSTGVSNSLGLQSLTALRQREPHIAALRQAFPHLTEGSFAWAQIHLALGDAHLKHGKRKHNPSPYWRDALRSYNAALPVFTVEAFPEERLQVLQGLIRASLALGDISTSRSYQQQGRQIFEQLRSRQPNQLKPDFESKFSSFSQLEIDLLVGEHNPIAALEQAEFYKNRCLTWILDDWQETVASPDYDAIMQALCLPDTVLVYWHLSPDALTTFILTANQEYPIVLESDRRQPAQQLENWRSQWDADYRSYASKKSTSTQELLSHPWRKALESRLAKLSQILHIDDICKQLPDTTRTLILLPHRDLHRFPIHALFPDHLTCTYLPSAQIGLNGHERWQQQPCYVPLLNVDDPRTEQPDMPFAQLESAMIRYLVKDATSIDRDDAAIDTVLTKLQDSYTTFHFTGHGAYNAFRPGDSALALTDGLLAARTISQLNLGNYSLVCLAACETALTGQDGIATEYVGLASAFLKAGAANVLSTLWQVDEISSAWLMIQFYQNLLAGKSPAIALKESQQWLRSITWAELADWIHQLSQRPGLEQGLVDLLESRATNTLKEGSTIGLNQPTKYQHPYYWAAFTITGRG